jgi:hypothetical protein
LFSGLFATQTTHEERSEKGKGRAMRIPTAILLCVLIEGVPACGSSGSSPATPTPQPQTSPPAPVQLATFQDPTSTFLTSDVRDVDGQIVRFDKASNSLIWAADNRSFSGYPVDGNFIRTDRAFQVRFGTENGDRRAYFTETVAETICDIQVSGAQLLILPTNVRVPGGG